MVNWEPKTNELPTPPRPVRLRKVRQMPPRPVRLRKLRKQNRAVAAPDQTERRAAQT
jgi:hypothetical protein